MKSILKTILFLLFTISVTCMQTSAKPNVKTENKKLEIRSFNAEKIASYQKDRRFIYEEPKLETSSWLDRLFYKLLKFFSKIYPQTNLGRSVYLLIFIGLLILIVFMILKNGIPSLFYSSKKINQNVSLINDLDASDSDIEQRIQDAVLKQDYRLAIRFLFSKLLKLLVANEQIKWQLNKTNRDYAYELKNESIRNRFRQLSEWYEYAWYGNFVIGIQVFETIQTEFNQFFKTYNIENQKN